MLFRSGERGKGSHVKFRRYSWLVRAQWWWVRTRTFKVSVRGVEWSGGNGMGGSEGWEELADTSTGRGDDGEGWMQVRLLEPLLVYLLQTD